MTFGWICSVYQGDISGQCVAIVWSSGWRYSSDHHWSVCERADRHSCILQWHENIPGHRQVVLSTATIFMISLWIFLSPCHSLTLIFANSRVERGRTDDLMPNVPISCLPSSRVNPKVQGMKVIIDCPQSGRSRATYSHRALNQDNQLGLHTTASVQFSSVQLQCLCFTQSCPPISRWF